MKWWTVWLSKKDGQFHAVEAVTEFGATMTAMTLCKPGAVINGVDLNYANKSWALQAPKKKIAIKLAKEEWAKYLLETPNG